MSSIDERIVSMKFDNKQFEQNVGNSLNTLDRLKKGLDLSNSAKGLDAVSESAKRVSFDGLSSGIEAVRVKFSALQVVAITTLSNIVNSAVNAGKNLASSLSIEPIIDGFHEYETQMNSVQTVLANTASKGTTLKDVKDSLNELNTYADKTIYNFTEMTRNIGTFTAAGVDLKTSTAAIKGIANLAAMSGSSSEQASSAMYQLSQAMAAGTVKLQDWNSVVNAGMGGENFQKSLEETARVHGVKIDDMIKKEGSFRESLQSGWLTTGILTETLSKYTGDLSESQLKALGYSKDQITQIIKMGQTANDAATKVKTFSQLIDTLKEAVGSGWAQTWQTVFGDFEEAKVLFTNISNTLGGMISSSSNARNNMLNGWKDLGGRTILIDAIGTAFTNLMNIMGAVSKAFREVFPATTSKQLYDMTVGLKSFISSLTPSKTTLENLKNTFAGLFAILDIGKQLLSSVVKGVVSLMGPVGNLSGGILGITGSFGTWLVAIDNFIKKSDIFNKIIQTLVKGIKDGFGGLTYVFETVANALGKHMSTIEKSSDHMHKSVTKSFSDMGDAISKSKFGQVLEVLGHLVETVVKGIGILLGKLADSFINTFKNANFNGFLALISGLSMGGIAIAISKFLKSVSEPLKGFRGIIDSITKTLDSVRGCFENYQKKLKADILMKLAIAIGILSLAIIAISLIDSKKLLSSLTAMGTMFGLLITAMGIYNKIADSSIKTTISSLALINMSLAILILSSALKELSKLNWEGIAKGGVGIAMLSTILVASAKILSSNSGAMIKGSTGLVMFSLAIKILASACKELASLSLNGLIKGLTGVGVLCAEISLFLNTAKFSGKTTSTALGILVLAEAMRVLAKACDAFGHMSWTQIIKGLTGIGLILTELSLFTNSTGNAKHVISTGLSLMIIAEAMKGLAKACDSFGHMSWTQIAKGLVAMAGSLVAIGLAMKLMPNNMILTSVGLIGVAVAMNILAPALDKIGHMSWTQIAKGLVTMGGSLLILAIGLSAMTGSISGSAALLIAATALSILAPALDKIGHMSWTQIAKGLVTLAGSLLILTIGLTAMTGTIAGSAALLIAAGALAILAPTLVLLGSMSWMAIARGLTALAGTFVILGVAGVVLGPLIPVILALSAAIVLLGLSVAAIGAGLALASLAVSSFALVSTAGATAIVSSLSIIILGVAALIPAIMTQIGLGVVAFCAAIANSAPALFSAFQVILVGFINLIITDIPLIVGGFMQLLSALLNQLIIWGPILAQQFFTLILSLLGVISNNIGKFVDAGVSIVVNFINGVARKIPDIIQAGWNLVIAFINGMADGINNNYGRLEDAMGNLMHAVLRAGLRTLEDGAKSFWKAGVNCVEGFINGLGSAPEKIAEAGGKLGTWALNAARKAIDSHSPSKEFAKLGSYGGEGFVIGLETWALKSADAGENLGNKSLKGVTKAIASISSLIDNKISAKPTITPVLDLSSIQNGSKELYNMIDNVNGYAVNGSINLATKTVANKASIISKDIQSNRDNRNDNQLSSTFKEALNNVKDSFTSSIAKLKEAAPQINFDGQYSFNNKDDIDYFMNQAALIIQRRNS